jgi:hypothetical protein
MSKDILNHHKDTTSSDGEFSVIEGGLIALSIYFVYSIIILILYYFWIKVAIEHIIGRRDEMEDEA